MIKLKSYFSNIQVNTLKNKKLLFFISLFFILLINIKVSSGVANFTDLTTELGTYFMGLSQKPLSHIFAFSTSWGPLYAIWLKFVSLFTSDIIDTYYKNIVILSVLSSSMIFIYINSIVKNSIVAVISSFLWIICQLNLPLNAKMAEFALILIVMGAYFSTLPKTNSAKLFVLSFFMLMASYVRPEFFTGFIICFVVALFFAFREKEEIKYNGFYSLFAIVPSFIIMSFMFKH